MLNKKLTTANVTVKNDGNQQMVRVQQMKRDQLLCKQALKQRESWISDDDISSDVITTSSRWEIQSQAVETNDWTTSCKHIVTSSWTTRRKQQLIQSRASMNQLLLCIQSQALCTSRKLQRFVYSVDMESSRKKADVVESYNPDAKYPVAVFEASAGAKYSVFKVTSRSDEPAAKQLTIYEELSKLDARRHRLVKLKRCVLDVATRTSRWLFGRDQLPADITLRHRFDKLERCYFGVFSCDCLLGCYCWFLAKERDALNHLMVEIQQRRKFSSWRFSDVDSHLATFSSWRFSDADFIVSTKLHNSDFSTQIQILDAGNFTREIQRELSRVQARFHAVTAKFRLLCWHRPKYPDFTLFTPDFSQGPSISALLENQTLGFALYTQIQTSKMPHRRRGRGRGKFLEESEGQNEEVQRSVPRRGRDRQIDLERLGEPQLRPFQQPGPSRFGQYSHPQFSGPQFAQVNAMTREQAKGNMQCANTNLLHKLPVYMFSVFNIFDRHLHRLQTRSPTKSNNYN
ncbi:receptor-like protein kinase [Dorcoceras hygrometricum]|uniref:Receptor-like protein kinase n=1 Tax=Dorcoceras hygrometricum TaxID=472368 RepID=A0A2Z7C624_9LAMI|nr:receptor-like protein kinase [Dorcoceras hygrometricum]